MKTWFKYDFDNAALDRENKFIAFQGKDYLLLSIIWKCL